MDFMDAVHYYGEACATLARAQCTKEEAERTGNHTYDHDIERLIAETEALRDGFEDNVQFFYDMARRGYSL